MYGLCECFQCGNMKLLMSCLLLALHCAPSSWGSNMHVTQSADIRVTEGQDVNITCYWTGNFNGVVVKWLKNNTTVRSKDIQQDTKTTLTIHNITREESGKYVCQVFVDIPALNVWTGNGTRVTVENQEPNYSGGSGETPWVISLASVASLVLVMIVVFLKLERRQEARVIYEVPHSDSDSADMDKRNSGSSGASSQWCQVDVYESVDYFERVEMKQSG
ncbi:uncharacterized protein LOC133560813 isoform X2 [Nerophis ophidion]|uniref:uncharacterized protein LOC133560813 isoform X2 n=1 Tax=Nerophis ophidion TaxID=159077 RepID=UPI002AE0343F|nr:uncharacterized protein LOC133560813 isoform X2 [Nerophis ophidion]